MTKELLKLLLSGYSLPLDGRHGLRHWARVSENGTKLAECTNADHRVVELFALFHDCRRVNEGLDPGHGLRGGEVARNLHENGGLGLTVDQFSKLHYACEHHTKGLIEADITIQTCWDADRLDLGRVRIRPDPKFLCTSAAKEPAIIEWAEDRSRSDYQPPMVETWLSWRDSGE